MGQAKRSSGDGLGATRTIRVTRRLSDSDARLRQAGRLARPLMLMQLLADGTGWTKMAVAKQLECSVKTVERTLAVLELAGIPVSLDARTGKCRLQEDCVEFPVAWPLSASLNENLVRSISESVGGTPSTGLSRHRRRMPLVIDRAARNLVDVAATLISVVSPQAVDHSAQGRNLQDIQIALATRRQLKVRYSSPFNDGESESIVHPWRLVHFRSAWYLIACPAGAKAARTFRVVRFRDVSILELSADLPAEFDLRAYFGNAWGVFRGDRAYHVKLRFHGPAARVVGETRWHSTQIIEPQVDGTALVHFDVDGLDEIIWWLMSWAPFVQVEEPDELRKRLVVELKKGIDLNCEIRGKWGGRSEVGRSSKD